MLPLPHRTVAAPILITANDTDQKAEAARLVGLAVRLIVTTSSSLLRWKDSGKLEKHCCLVTPGRAAA